MISVRCSSHICESERLVLTLKHLIGQSKRVARVHLEREDVRRLSVAYLAYIRAYTLGSKLLDRWRYNNNFYIYIHDQRKTIYRVSNFRIA